MKNSGIINVNGLNSTGLQVINAGQLNSDGTINVDGEGISSGFRNYGAWVEGARSNANVIRKNQSFRYWCCRVFAKDGGSLTLSGNGAVLFGSSDQIGFYVYGKDSAIHNTGSGVMDVSTENSTLFRIASGATFQGTADASSALTASGKNSYALYCHGEIGWRCGLDSNVWRNDHQPDG